jgi:hypothetical protein
MINVFNISFFYFVLICSINSQIANLDSNCRFDITFDFDYVSKKSYIKDGFEVIEVPLIQYMEERLNMPGRFRFFHNVPNSFYSYGFKVVSKSCSQELLHRKIMDHVYNESRLKFKTVIDTTETWTVVVVDSQKLFNCGIYFDYVKNGSDMYGYPQLFSSRNSIKYWDNITGNLISMGDKNRYYIDLSESRTLLDGIRKWDYNGLGMDFENYLFFYIPDQIQYDLELFRNVLFDYAGIDIKVSNSTSEIILFYLDASDKSRVKNKFWSSDFMVDPYYYPHNVKRIYN